ncbi:Na/Pi cotransporter family protein [Hominifimenecus sp. rT4P-3]|uniref:Na/Pi cotransporter family protein n=1 Tax=Hominifimenecus sp. rT4P-3 TaxID=3242979 RepID=UPI003DA385E4
MFYFFGGLGIFLYGIHEMSEAMEQLFAGRFRQRLMHLVSGRFRAIALGCGITGVVQSSTVVTVMIVSLVEAGLLPLRQAFDLIMGANVGTTVTAWMISMKQLPSVPWLMPALAAGGFLCMAWKRFPWKRQAELAMGFGLLFLGLDWMEEGITAGNGLDGILQWVLAMGEKPLAGILAGIVLVCIIQSSSAGIGILQVLALSGQISWSAAVYLTLGQNIGTCLTTLLAGVSLGAEAKAAARFHLIFNLAGVVVLAPVCAAFFSLNTQIAAQPITPTGLALFHTVFNVVSVAGVYPFVGKLAKWEARRIQSEVLS